MILMDTFPYFRIKREDKCKELKEELQQIGKYILGC